MLFALVLSVLAADAEPKEVQLKAERLMRDGLARRTTAEGNASLVADGAAVSADRIVYDEEKRVATASGNVALRIVKRGLIAVTADAAAIFFDGNEVREVFIYDGLAVRKKNTTAEALFAADTPQKLDATGEVMMTLTGSHLTHAGDDWIADDIVFVPCDCDFQHPSWGIHAAQARINFDDDRVSLLSPTVRIKGVPVFWLPWISLPLTDRQTGFLVPRPTFSGLSGFGIEEPVFITLGRSADLTITPGYFFGPSDVAFERAAIARRRRGAPAELNGNSPDISAGGVTLPGLRNTPFNSPHGIAGPRLLTEFRYAPSWTTTGRINLGLIYDLRAQRDPVDPSLRYPEDRGLRGELSIQHRSLLFERVHFDVGATLLSDGYYLRDITADVLARESFYNRSQTSVYRRGDDTWLSLEAVFRQDTSWGYSLFRKDPLLKASIPSRGPNPFHRLPALTFAVPERRLLGPVTFSVRAEFVRLAPISGISGDEGRGADEGNASALIDTGDVVPQLVRLKPECVQQRLYLPTGPNASLCPGGVALPDDRADEGDRTWQPGERQARDRFDVFPRLGIRGSLGDVLGLSAQAAWRQDVWVGEADGSAWWRGYPLFSGRADTELAKTYPTQSGGLRHIISASVELKGSPVILGNAPVAYDEIDGAWPDRNPRLQAVAEIRQRLLSKQGGAVQEHLRLDLGQGAELVGPDGVRLSESYGRLGVRVGWFAGDLALRVDGPRGRVSRVAASASLDDGQGRGLFASWENLLDDGTERSRQPIDLLFGNRAGLGNARAQVLTFGGRFRYEGFTARYEALLLDRVYTTSIPAIAGLPQIDESLKALTFVQHSLALGYGPRCDCWRIEVYATQRTAPLIPSTFIPDFGASVTLTGFGAFGTGG